MSNLAQVLENLSWAEKWRDGLFTAADEAAAAAVREIFEKRMKTPCTGCGYCLPCPSGVDIPKNLSFLNQYHLFEAQEAKERCRYFYGIQLAPAEMADQCAGCRECEEKCPQHIAIADFLAETARVFKV
jgi:predicted aldo/keto reductase-like oxidoreductase